MYDEQEGPKHWIPVIGIVETLVGTEFKRYLNIACVEMANPSEGELTKVSGIDVLFVGPESDIRMFDNKVMEFDPERGYFLRD